MTDWGVHLLDFALFGMNVTAPKSIMAMGGKYGYPDDACETPDSLQTIYEFEGFNVMWDHAIGINDGGYGRNAVLGFVGENGTLVVDRGGWEVIPEVVNKTKRMEAVPWKNGTGQGLKNNVKNHLDCIASRNQNTTVNTEIGAHIAKFSALGNIAYRTGKKLVWDGTKFTNDTDANTYLIPSYREPWKLPKV
jgi:predicted dehydrogenase